MDQAQANEGLAAWAASGNDTWPAEPGVRPHRPSVCFLDFALVGPGFSVTAGRWAQPGQMAPPAEGVPRPEPIPARALRVRVLLSHAI